MIENITSKMKKIPDQWNKPEKIETEVMKEQRMPEENHLVHHLSWLVTKIAFCSAEKNKQEQA